MRCVACLCPRKSEIGNWKSVISYILAAPHVYPARWRLARVAEDPPARGFRLVRSRPRAAAARRRERRCLVSISSSRRVNRICSGARDPRYVKVSRISPRSDSSCLFHRAPAQATEIDRPDHPVTSVFAAIVSPTALRHRADISARRYPSPSARLRPASKKTLSRDLTSVASAPPSPPPPEREASHRPAAKPGLSASRPIRLGGARPAPPSSGHP